MSLRIGQLSAGFFVAGQLSATDLDKLNGYGIRSIVNNRPDHEDPGQETRAQEPGPGARPRGFHRHGRTFRSRFQRAGSRRFS